MVWLFLGCTSGPTPVPSTEPGTVPFTPPVLDTAATDTGVDYGLEEPWVLMLGGDFLMGSPPDSEGRPNEMPQHAVSVETFAIMRHEVLHLDYMACVDDGACNALAPGCYSGTNPLRPATCLDWQQATDFCDWYGGRLPTEAEWEFAASSRGTEDQYPWGVEEPDCTRANAGDGMGTPDCGSGVWNVCEHPLGDTPLGLCEMGGNVFEWVQDWYWDDYSNHPSDGSAMDTPNNNFKSMRGGAIGSGAPLRLRTRTFHPPHFRYGGMGARCVMDL